MINMTNVEYADMNSGRIMNLLVTIPAESRKMNVGKDVMDVSKFYHGDYYLEEEVKTMRGKGIASRKKSSI